MIQNKLLNIILIILIAVSLLAIGGVLTYMLVFDGKAPTTEEKPPKELTGTDVLELSVATEKITTNLADRRMVILSLSFLAENKKAKEELEQRMIQLKDIIITTLHSQTREDLETSEGLEAYKLLVLQKINEIMIRGQITDIYIVEKIIQ